MTKVICVLVQVFLISSLSFAETTVERSAGLIGAFKAFSRASGSSGLLLALPSFGKIGAMIHENFLKSEEISEEAKKKENSVKNVIKHEKTFEELAKERKKRIRELREKIEEARYSIMNDGDRESVEEMKNELVELLTGNPWIGVNGLEKTGQFEEVETKIEKQLPVKGNFVPIINLMPAKKEQSAAKSDGSDLSGDSSDVEVADPKSTQKDQSKGSANEVQSLAQPKKQFKKKNWHYHSRLLLGEADFSFCRAFIIKHPESEVVGNIVATEKEETLTRYPNFDENQAFITGEGVSLRLAIDCTKMAMQLGTGVVFDRIHFNMPNDRSLYQSNSMALLIDGLFAQSSVLQENGGRVYLTIAEPNGSKKYFYHLHFELKKAVEKNGYGLVGKRKFTSDGYNRYPGYEHCQTQGPQMLKVEAATNTREYVFQKGSPHTKTFNPKTEELYRTGRGLIERFDAVTTDDDSTDCFSEHSGSEGA